MRRLLYIVLGGLALVAFVLLALWLGRIPIARHVLVDRLDQAGFPQATFRITALDWNHLRLQSLKLAPAPAPSTDAVVVRYAPWRLLHGDWADIDVTVIGLRARLVSTADGPALAGMPESGGTDGAAVTGADRSAAALATVPSLHLRAGRIELESRWGRWTTRVDADIEGGPNGPRSGNLEGRLVNHRLAVAGEFSADYNGSRITARANLEENDGFRIRLNGRVREPLGDAPRAQLDYAVRMPAAADLPWAFLPGAPPSAGRVTLKGEARGRIADSSLPGDTAGWMRALDRGGWNGRYRVESQGLSLNARFDDLDLQAGGGWHTESGALVMTTKGDGDLRVGHVDESLWSRLSTAGAAEPYLAGPFTMHWSPGEWGRITVNDDRLQVEIEPRLEFAWPQQPAKASLQAHARMTLAGDGRLLQMDLPRLQVRLHDVHWGGVTLTRVQAEGSVQQVLTAPAGRLDLSAHVPRLQSAGVDLRDVTLRLPLTIAQDRASSDKPAAPRFTLRAPGRLRASVARLPGDMRAAGPVTATVADGQADFGKAGEYRVRLALDPARFTSMADGPARPTFEVGSGSVVLAGRMRSDALPTVALHDFAASMPQRGVRATGIEARLQPASNQDWLVFSVARLAETGAKTGAERRIAPINVSGHIDRGPGEMRLAGKGSVASGAAPFTWRGRARPDARMGDIEVEVPVVAFAPEGLQPSVLVPALSMLEEVGGRVGGSARIAWNEKGVDGQARAQLRDVDLSIEGVRIEGLEGRLALAHLRPLRTAEPQQLRARRIDAGLGIDEPTLRFALVGLSGGRTGIHVVAAQGHTIDGTVAVRDWQFDPRAQVYAPTLEVEGVSLEKLLDRLSISGLRGRGALSGAVPISIAPGGLAIRKGRLRGLGGHVQYDSARADQALGDTARTVDLTLQALKNFEYDRIEIGLERELEGASRVNIHMRGRNPDVLDGHPFNFNIDITGDVDPLLKALAHGRELTDELIRRNLQLRSRQQTE